MRDRKDARLSFRITNDVSDEIDDMVRLSKLIKDRSDFGTKAVKLYISYLKEEDLFNNLVKNAISRLSEELDANHIPEIMKLKENVETEI